jgi:hypothetical protein
MSSRAVSLRPITAVLTPKKRIAFVSGAYFSLIICCVALICASQQAASETNIDDGCVGAEQNKAFEFRLGPSSPPRIIVKFVTRPGADADAAQIRRHVHHWKVMGGYVSSHSSSQCIFAAGMNSSLVPSFEFSTLVPQRDRGACLPRACIQTLSNIFLSAVVDKQAFSTAVDRLAHIARDSNRSDIPTSAYSVRAAEREAFRQIYRGDTRERIVLDVSAEDYRSVDFDQFTVWLLKQQDALRAVLNGTAPPVEPPSPDQSLQLSPPCSLGPEAPIEQLNVDHHGWGHQSIIMINYSVGGENDNRVISRMLRAFCPHYEVNPALDGQPRHEMADRMSCYTIGFAERTQWLVAHSKRVQQSAVDVQRYAQAMAKTLNAARCSDLRLRIIVANFLQQK